MRRIIVLLVLFIILISCETKKERIYREEIERFEENCEKLITKYNSIDVMNNLSYRNLYLTVELEKYFIQQNENSIYLEVELNDIISNDSSYIVKFNYDFWPGPEPEIYFTLDCERKLGDKLLETNPKISNNSWDSYFVIIASISSMQKIRFDLSCVTDDEYASIEVYPSDIFLAKGRLIDFVYRE